jgi:hypothetical protein
MALLFGMKSIAKRLFRSLSLPSLERLLAFVERLEVLLEDRIRQIRFSGRTVSRDGISAGCPHLKAYLMEDHSPWTGWSVDAITMPGMITGEESQYYEYVGGLYQGRGEAIELGPWLGKSTRHIIRGLDKNPHFIGKQLHVFDDFVWRSAWMNRHFSDDQCPSNHSDFRDLFESYVFNIRSRLKLTKGKIVNHDGNETLPQIEWNAAPIEIMYIDCGRTFEVNEAWYRIFSPNLIPNVSLLIMQDWRTHRERPRLAINETHWFTAAHPELAIVHEVKDGGIATFIYNGHQQQ